MKILAVDTATGKCSVALFQEDSLKFYLEEKELHKQSEKLLPMIELALEHLGWIYKDLSYLAVNIGPGSFTGIRIGVSAVNAIALAINKEIIGVTGLEALAMGEEGKTCVVIDAGRSQFYGQKYDNIQCEDKPRLIDKNQLDAYCSGYKLLGHKLPDAKLIGLEAMKRLKSEKLIAAKQLMPFYIREPDAKIPGSKISN